MTTSTHARAVTDASVRRWLMKLAQPDRLAEDEELQSLLARQERLPDNGSRVELGHAAADLIREAIDRLEPEGDAPRQERLPYEVLRTCFVEGAKLFQAANKLGMSERQMTRERTRAIRILKGELERPATPAGSSRYRPVPIPAIQGFLPRPELATSLGAALREHRLVRVHGPAGVGKSSLLADLASDEAERMPVLWYRFRTGVADSVDALLFEIGEHLRSRRHHDLAAYMADALPTPDPALATRLALKGLAASPHLLVFDDFHIADGDPAVAGFLEEAISRLPDLRVITIGRHRHGSSEAGISIAIAPFSQSETQSLLAQLGLETTPELASAVQSWTEGIPQLVKLAASWLKTATPREIEEGLDSLGELEEVQGFLLTNITDLIGANDRAILEAASIFRDRFTDDALAFVAERTRGEVQDTSRRLVRAYVATRSRAGDVAFFHNSVRDYVYDRLPLARRRELHERAAAWYRRNDATDESEYHEGAARRATPSDARG